MGFIESPLLSCLHLFGAGAGRSRENRIEIPFPPSLILFPYLVRAAECLGPVDRIHVSNDVAVFVVGGFFCLGSIPRFS
jgi:hypothetical protein